MWNLSIQNWCLTLSFYFSTFLCTPHTQHTHTHTTHTQLHHTYTNIHKYMYVHNYLYTQQPYTGANFRCRTTSGPERRSEYGSFNFLYFLLTCFDPTRSAVVIRISLISLSLSVLLFDLHILFPLSPYSLSLSLCVAVTCTTWTRILITISEQERANCAALCLQIQP